MAAIADATVGGKADLREGKKDSFQVSNLPLACGVTKPHYDRWGNVHPISFPKPASDLSRSTLVPCSPKAFFEVPMLESGPEQECCSVSLCTIYVRRANDHEPIPLFWHRRITSLLPSTILSEDSDKNEEHQRSGQNTSGWRWAASVLWYTPRYLSSLSTACSFA